MDINVDMGESFGRYTLGDDEGIMKAGATSANIATCFHAGDPNVLLRTVRGRSSTASTSACTRGCRTCRASVAGGWTSPATSCTPTRSTRSAPSRPCARSSTCRFGTSRRTASSTAWWVEDELYVDAFLKAVGDYDPALWIMCQRSDPIYERGLGMGLKMAAEALIDLGYDDEGHWVIERVKKARSEEEVGARAVQVANEGDHRDHERRHRAARGRDRLLSRRRAQRGRGSHRRGQGPQRRRCRGRSARQLTSEATLKGDQQVDATIAAHMPGLVARVVVEPGQKIGKGDEVAVINCMKAELSVESHVDGTVKEILVKEWDEMEVGVPMVVVETA